VKLALDIGNTLVKVGLFQKSQLVFKGEFATRPRKEVDEWGVLLSHWVREYGKSAQIEKAIVSSVVSSTFTPLKEAVIKYFGLTPFEVEAEKVGIPILVDNPGEVGADRIANVAACIHLYKLPAIVVDFGTATTFDVISEAGEYLGGVIAPGVRSSIEALAEKTEALFAVEYKRPLSIIGKNTKEALISGNFYYSLGGMMKIVREIKKELGTRSSVITTGGLGPLLARDWGEIDEVNPDLTLQGLNLIVERY
jgi:type III pantothenate kinase